MFFYQLQTDKSGASRNDLPNAEVVDRQLNQRDPTNSKDDSQLRSLSNKNENRKISIDDLKFIKVLGRGGFGKVMLAELNSNPDEIYSVKIIKKSEIKNQRDINYIIMEKNVLNPYNKTSFLIKHMDSFKPILDFL